jgi:hypothetical protein
MYVPAQREGIETLRKERIVLSHSASLWTLKLNKNYSYL